MRKVLVLFLAAWVAVMANAQVTLEPKVQTSNVDDSIGVLQPRLTQKPPRLPKPHPWKAAAEVVGINTFVHCYDRFIAREDFAKTTLNY